MKLSYLNIISLVLIILSYPLKDINNLNITIFLLVISIAILLIDELKEKTITGTGSFIFGSFLFFGMRPLYILLEKDYVLFQYYFYVTNFEILIAPALWWAAAGLYTFKIGSKIIFNNFTDKLAYLANNNISDTFNSSAQTKYLLIAVCAATFPIIYSLSKVSLGLYSQASGAYLYDLPIVIQSVVCFVVLIFAREFFRKKSWKNFLFSLSSIIYLLYFSLQMRNISLFRGFYLTGIMIIGIALVHLFFNSKVGYQWLIVPIVLIQPIFQELGLKRAVSNTDFNLGGFFQSIFQRGILRSYWDFYSSAGDINIFDTFIAAFNAKPDWYPTILSWLYVPFHLIPRAIWSSKPVSGILQDVSFADGIPYSPGLIGYFILDGGKLWMLFSMLLLGIFLGNIDNLLYKLPNGILKSFLYGTISIIALITTRFFLWQGFYQAIYAIVPAFLISLIVFPRKLKKNKS